MNQVNMCLCVCLHEGETEYVLVIFKYVYMFIVSKHDLSYVNTKPRDLAQLVKEFTTSDY